MSWQVRHEGSPNATPNLSAQQVLTGVAEGVWEPSDEVRGSADADWRSIESHPFFEEAVQEIELPEGSHEDGETHLDMNPLIDVALVLLIFFIITASYDALKKVINMPAMSAKGGQTKVIDDPKVINQLIRVEARMTPDGKSVIYKVDGNEVPEDKLQQAMEIGVAQKRNKLLIDAENVRWVSVVKIIDAGKGAHVDKFMMRVKE
jgi:biopolymer transport protein ExbD